MLCHFVCGFPNFRFQFLKFPLCKGPSNKSVAGSKDFVFPATVRPLQRQPLWQDPPQRRPGGAAPRGQRRRALPRGMLNVRSDVWRKLNNFLLQSVSKAWSQGLLESFCASSSGNFLLFWLHSMSHRPGELPEKLSSKPCNQAIDALCIS